VIYDYGAFDDGTREWDVRYGSVANEIDRVVAVLSDGDEVAVVPERGPYFVPERSGPAVVEQLVAYMGEREMEVTE
jgi:hypothetical protein